MDSIEDLKRKLLHADKQIKSLENLNRLYYESKELYKERLQLANEKIEIKDEVIELHKGIIKDMENDYSHLKISFKQQTKSAVKGWEKVIEHEKTMELAENLGALNEYLGRNKDLVKGRWGKSVSLTAIDVIKNLLEENKRLHEHWTKHTLATRANEQAGDLHD